MTFQSIARALALAAVAQPAFAQSIIPLPLQPAAQWTLNVPLDSGGACHPALNPMEINFTNVVVPGLGVAGVELTSHSTQAQCCSCIARERQFPLGKTLNTTADAVHLQGSFAAQRTASDPFSLASFSIALFHAGQRQFGQVFVAEKRPNNNCAVYPQTVIAPSANMDIALDTLAPNVSFDTVVVNAMGYGCGATSPNSVAISNFTLHTGAGSGGAAGAGGAPVPTLIMPVAVNVPNIPVAFNFNTANPGCASAGMGAPSGNTAFQLNLSQTLTPPNNVTFVVGTPGWVPGQPPTTLNFAFSAKDTNAAFPTAGDTIQVTTSSADPLIQALVQALNSHVQLNPPPPSSPAFDTVDVNLTSWIAYMTAHGIHSANGALQFVDTGRNSTAHPGAFHCGGPFTVSLTITLI
jgi:hypothetical protein